MDTNNLSHVISHILHTQIVEGHVFTTIRTTTVVTNILLAALVVTLPLVAVTFDMAGLIAVKTLNIT